MEVEERVEEREDVKGREGEEEKEDGTTKMTSDVQWILPGIPYSGHIPT